jgi:cytochrome c oxidase subunit 1
VGIYATSIIQVLATPVIGPDGSAGRHREGGGFGLFDATRSGDVLFQHLFWFYSHSGHIMVLPPWA